MEVRTGDGHTWAPGRFGGDVRTSPHLPGLPAFPRGHPAYFVRLGPVFRSCLGVAALVFMGLAAWVWLGIHGYLVGDHQVDVRVTYVGSGADDLGEVAVIVDSDKVHWPYILPGETERATLSPTGGTTSLTLIFDLRGERRVWIGPDLGYGPGYRIAIQIDANGDVTDQHCMMPCPVEM
ncbi:MAG: hypothetical protein RL385_4146 [Pseudomonadota bacterium]